MSVCMCMSVCVCVRTQSRQQLKTTLQVHVSLQPKSSVSQVNSKHMKDRLHHSLYKKFCVCLCVRVCVCACVHMRDTQVPQDRQLESSHDPEEEMTTCRLHEVDQQEGVGVWTYKDRPSLWDTSEGDWRRRARRERSKAATISGAAKTKPPKASFGRSSCGAAERVQAALGCVSACAQDNCRFSLGLRSSMVALPGKNAEWGGLGSGNGLGNLLRGPLAMQSCHRLVPTATNKVSTDFVALQTEVTQRPSDDMTHRTVFILFLSQVYSILLISK